jgi:hypothetical protein
MSGVDAAAANRFAVTAQLTATGDSFNCTAMMPNTGTTAVCSTATVNATSPNETINNPGRG